MLDFLADTPDHLDDLLCDIVTRRRFRRKDVGFGNKRSVRVLLEEVVVRENVHSVELLALVLVQALYLNVENAVKVELNARRLFNELRKTLLVFSLDLTQSFENGLVVCEYLELDKLRGVLLETVAYALSEQIGKTLIALEQPAAVCDTVCDVLELVGLVEVLETENVVLDDLRVQLGNAVYAVRRRNAKVRHVDFAVLND